MEKSSDHFVRLPTKLLDELCRIRISGEARQVLDVIIRKTIGYGKEEDWISLSQFRGMTGMPENATCRAIKHLLKMKIIHKKGRDGKSFYSVEKQSACWEPLSKKRGGDKNANVLSQKGEAELSKRRDTIDTDTKETTTKESVGLRHTTPAEYARSFFANDAETMRCEAEYFRSSGFPMELVRQEFLKFCNYWQEQTPSGGKELWQTKKTFEIRRRLVRWFSKVAQDYQKRRGSLTMPDFRTPS